MGHDGLVNIASTLISVFGKITIAQGLVQTTRVALISYASNAKIIANLTEYTNSHGLMKGLYSIKPSNDAQVNILDALRKTDIVREGVNEVKTRRTVIVLVASAYNAHGRNDPAPFANQIKESGVKILTIAFVRYNEGYDEVQELSEIASPGFSFTTKTNQSPLVGRIQEAFCHANCFCPNGWAHVTDDFQKPTIKYAEWVRLSTASTDWFGASMACANEVNNNAFLASERSAAKHKFHIDYVRSINAKMPPYFIGLSWYDASQQYIWSEKFDNGNRIPLDPSAYETWASGNGIHRQNENAVQVVPLGFLTRTGTMWTRSGMIDIPYLKTTTNGVYMCQVNAYDTDNYCDDSVDDDQ